MVRFDVVFRGADQEIPMRLQGDEGRFAADFGAVQQVTLVPATYEGAYEVTPQVTAQMLATKQKTMKEDLRVKEIPFFEVGNNSGGSTVYIGAELE